MLKMLRKLWLIFCWGLLLLVVLTAVGGVLALYHLNNQLQQYVLDELKERFPELDINVQSVRLDEMKGITIGGFEASIPADKNQNARPLLHIREIFIDYPITLKNLYRQNFQFKKIIYRNPVFRITRNANGQFDELQRLKTKQTKFAAVPIEIVGGTLLYEDRHAAQPAPLQITGVDLTLTPKDENTWQCNVKADGDMFRQFNAEGQYNTETKHWQFSATCRQLDWVPSLFAYLPYTNRLLQNPDYASIAETFQGRFDLTVAAEANTESATDIPVRFAVEGFLSQGRADIPKIHRTLSELNTKFRITENSIHIEKLTGIAEAARLVCSYRQEGLPVPQSAILTANIHGLAFDKAFVEILNPFLNDATEHLLSRYEYAGTTDLDAEVAYQNGSWKPQSLQLQLTDLSFLFKDFPYKTERLTGSLFVNQDAKLGFHLVTKPGEAMNAEIVGDYVDVFRYPVGEVRVHAVGVPIDRKLMKAFPKQHQDVVASLHPTGKVNALLRIVRPADGLPLQKEIEVGLDRVSVQYEKFPYKLRDVFGVLRLNDDCWTFQNVIGSNGSSAVRCDGHLQPIAKNDGTSGTELLINVHAEELPIDEQLHDAVLNQNQRELLKNLNVQGKTNLDAQIQFLMPENQLNLRFRSIPCAGLSMKPSQFPYKIDNVRGEIYYDNGNIIAKRIEAENRDTKIQTGLECQFDPSGAWKIRLQPFIADRWVSDRELHEALPENLRSILETLQIGKPINLNGVIEFSKQKESSPLLTVWDINVLLHQNSITAAVPLENIFGKVQLSGFSEGTAMQFAGEIDLNSVTIKGFQTTDVKGPFFFDGRPTATQPGRAQANYLYFGQQPGRVLPQPPDYISVQNFIQSPWFGGTVHPRPFQGKFFGGTILAEGLAVIENGSFSYSVNSALYGADLAKIAKETAPNAQKFSGVLNCVDFHFYGNGTKWDTVGGSGKVQLRNANMFEAPGMVRVLRELSIRETDPNAGTFREADVDFRLLGNQVQLNSIELAADAFYLHGGGSMRLDTQTMDLAMKTRLGNRRTQIPVLSNIIGGAGDQFVQLNIHGPVTDPMIDRVALPEVQRALQHIQDETGGPPQVDSSSASPQQHGIFNRTRPF